MTKPAVHIADTDDAIAARFPVMQELRPHLKDAADLVARVRRMQKQGFELAYVAEGGKPVACMGFRDCEMLHRNQSFYVDDLVTLPAVRSKGYGGILLDWLEARAKREGKGNIHLDSGTQRLDAHRFYFRQRFGITSFHFVKTF